MNTHIFVPAILVNKAYRCSTRLHYIRVHFSVLQSAHEASLIFIKEHNIYQSIFIICSLKSCFVLSNSNQEVKCYHLPIAYHPLIICFVFLCNLYTDTLGDLYFYWIFFALLVHLSQICLSPFPSAECFTQF